MKKLSSVLLVDDDPTTNFLHEQLLLSLAVTDQVLVAHNGADALELLAHATAPVACPALVLLDVHMPMMDGIEFLEAYSLPPALPPVVVVLTTSMHSRDQARLEKLPVSGWVTKPLTREKVDAILQQYFQQHLPPEALEDEDR